MIKFLRIIKLLKADILLHRVSYAFLFLSLVIGIYARFHHLFSYAVFTYDQGRDMLVVRDLIVNHKLVLIGPVTGIAGVFVGPFFYYFLSIPFIFSGGHPLSGAVAVALTGVITVIIIYWTAVKVFDRTTGTIAALLASFSPFLVFYSRFAWNPNIAPFFAVLFYFALVKVCQGKQKYVWLLGASLGLALQLEASSAFFYIPTFLSCFLIFRVKNIALSIGKTLLLASFLNSSLLIFDLRHQFLISKGLFRFVFGNRNTGLILGQSFGERKTLFGDVFFGIFSQSNLLGKTLLLFLAASLFIYLIKVFKRRSRSIAIDVAAIWIAINLVGIIFYPGLVFEHFLISLVPILIILLAKAFSVVWLQNDLGKIVVYGLCLSMFLTLLPTYGLFKRDNGKEDISRRVSFDDQISTLQFIENDSGGKKFSVLVYTPSAIDYSYQYLIWWMQKNGHLSPYSKEASTTYLLMEPKQVVLEKVRTPYDDWYAFAKEIGVLSARVNPFGGITVEKRTNFANE